MLRQHEKTKMARLLLQRSARVSQDGNGHTPLLWAALHNSPDCVEFFLRRPEFSRKEKIDALELLGAVRSCNKHKRSYTYFKRAINERYRDPADIIPKPQRPPVAVLGGVVESQTPQELESRQKDWRKMRLEGLLVVERILGEDHKQVAVICEDICRDLVCKTRWEEAFAVWKYGRKHSVFVENLSRLDRHIKLIRIWLPPTFSFDQDILHLTVQEMEVQARAAELNRWYLCCAFVNVMECVRFIWGALQLASSDDDLNKLQDVTRRFIIVAPRFHPLPVIHLALSLAEYQLLGRFVRPESNASFVSFLQLLTKCGADVSKKGKYNNTPLHRICYGKWKKGKHMKFACSVARLLLEAGADVDARNNRNQTPLAITRSKEMRAVLLEHYPVSLKCLAASAIVQRRVPYQGLVPSIVENFIRIHKSC